MIAVLDTSAAVELVLQRESADRFSELLARADLVVAPNLLIAEATNVFWKYQKIADYPYDDCERAIEQIISLPDEYVSEKELYREAFSLGCMLNHSVYDMIFLVLARRNGARLLTMDKKLITAAEKAGVRGSGLLF